MPRPGSGRVSISVCLRGTVQDITERKATEEALKTSEEKLRKLFDTMTEGVALNEVDYEALPSNSILPSSDPGADHRDRNATESEVYCL